MDKWLLRNCNTGALAPQHVLTDDAFAASLELKECQGHSFNSRQAPSPPLLEKKVYALRPATAWRLATDTSHSGWPTVLWIADVLMLLKRLANMPQGGGRRSAPVHYPDTVRMVTRHAALALPAPIPSDREIPRAAFGRIASFDTAVALADRASDAAANRLGTNRHTPVIDLPHTRDWLHVTTMGKPQ